jgi:putative methanogenesis marker protein 8
MNAQALLKQIGIDPTAYDDLHVSRMFSAFVVVSHGKVIRVTDPTMTHCPLARLFYREYMDRVPLDDIEKMKGLIARAMEDKIARFGLFTGRRELVRNRIEVPYGASEMMMYALRKGAIDAAVVVCDGAGTVITDRPEVVQGIGARMNGLFHTTPIPGIVEELRAMGSTVVFENAAIGQIEGAREAVHRGYRTIAVTVNSFTDERPAALRGIEHDSLEIARDLPTAEHDLPAVERAGGARIVSLMVCATGAGEGRLREIARDADLVWSCGSRELREIVGRKAVLQITTRIPVFALTEKGLDFAAAYSPDETLIRELDRGKQHLITGRSRGERGATKLTMGTFQTYLHEAVLPVRDVDEPSFRS